MFSFFVAAFFVMWSQKLCKYMYVWVVGVGWVAIVFGLRKWKNNTEFFCCCFFLNVAET